MDNTRIVEFAESMGERFGVQLIIQSLHVFMMLHLNIVLIMDMDLQIQNKNVAKKSR